MRGIRVVYGVPAPCLFAVGFLTQRRGGSRFSTRNLHLRTIHAANEFVVRMITEPVVLPVFCRGEEAGVRVPGRHVPGGAGRQRQQQRHGERSGPREYTRVRYVRFAFPNNSEIRVGVHCLFCIAHIVSESGEFVQCQLIQPIRTANSLVFIAKTVLKDVLRQNRNQSTSA